ncbi:MAG: phage shock protein, partial [Sphingomonadales bacterium]|nr:phage shock protein [Sphingomonadales bacterium]
MEDVLGYMVGALAIVTIFVGLPWVIFHYITKWKTAAT